MRNLRRIATWLAGWWTGLTVEDKFEELKDGLRNLAFFYNLSCFTGPLSIFLVLLAIYNAADEANYFGRIAAAFCLVQFCIAYLFFHKSKKQIEVLRGDFTFINSQEALLIIWEKYSRARRPFREFMKDLFPSQLHKF